ncbi:MAG: hypothetical protein M1832_002035 [Thelocarpon impressellum]|nr:MAG: hypothetical protein M1832_002035 [Thelocarpon impressellum]
MSLVSDYQRFLASPTAAALADGAVLHYITTLTTIHDAAKIVKQLTAQHLKKREEKVISAVEGQNCLALEVATTIEFISSGGAYLPGLDDNFLADHVAALPIIHIVQFDADGKIQQIRLSWDQGSLLKNLDVIGARGRNWPIRDGVDQARLIASSVASAGRAVPARPKANSSAEEVIITGKRPGTSGSNNVTGDPHASLALFGPREAMEETSLPAAVAPRASAKPPPRDYHDLFVGNDSDASPVSTSKGNSFAGGKKSQEEPIAPKGGAGKNYQPSRLFDTEEAKPQAVPNHSAAHLYKANPKKYHHFDFADGSEEQDRPKPSPVKAKTKHESQWDFEDFATPQPTKNKVRGQDVRHFGWSDDEVNQDSPIKAKRPDKPRRDAETHFEFQDDGTPDGDKRPAGHPRGTSHNDGLGLYKNNVYDEDGNPSPPKQAQPLGNVTNTKHRKYFDSQFTMTDDSPASKDKPAEKQAPVNHQAAVKMMDSNWDAYDESPEQSKKENEAKASKARNTGIMTAGDGMGGRKGSGRQWGFGDDSDGEESGGVNGAAYQKGVPGKKQQAPAGNKLWDF